jgi:membrane protease YdiL (CAAX protease family)
LLLLVAALGRAVHAAPLPSPGEADSHLAYASQVSSAGDAALARFVAAYDAHLARFPRDAVAAVERCKLLNASLRTNDDDEDAPASGDAGLQELSRDCPRWLAARFPDAKEALLYQLDRKWGNEAVTLAEDLLARRALRWSVRERAHLHASLARQLSFDEKRAAQAAGHADRAMALDPTLDLANIVAKQFLAEGRMSEAIALLDAHPDKLAYAAAGKARLLAAGGAPAHALSQLDRLPHGDSFDPSLRASLLERLGRIDLARATYLQPQRDAAKRRAALMHVLAIDLARDDANAAAQSYGALRDLGWRNDPLLGQRLRLTRKFPSLRWSARDWLGLLRLLLALVLGALLPLAWVGPLHYWSLWRRLRRPRSVDPALDTRWSFAHLWLASAILLDVQLVTLDFFAPAEVTSWFLPAAEHAVTTPSALAAVALWNAALLTLTLGLALLRRRDLPLFGRGTWSIGRYIGMSAAGGGILIGVAIVNFVVVRIVSLARNLPHGAIGPDELVRALYQTHGILAVFVVAVVVAPVIEELMFRSVMLDTVARYMRFWPANLVQAAAFAAAHLEPSRFPYLFAVGLVAGWLRRRSGGLLPSITLHAMNNILATLVLIATASLGAKAKPQKAPPEFVPSPELVTCAATSHALTQPTTASLTGGGPQEAELLNHVAWTLVSDVAASPDCLAAAEEAVNGALRQLPEQAPIIDTKATVYFRQGRVADAVELEARASALLTARAVYSQLDRFLLRRRQRGGALLVGDGALSEVNVSFAPLLAPMQPGTRRVIRVQLGSGFKYGGQLYARIVGRSGSLALLRAWFGWQHAPTYEIVPPVDLPQEARIELALVDARGCDACASAAWNWELQAHDAMIDALP